MAHAALQHIAVQHIAMQHKAQGKNGLPTINRSKYLPMQAIFANDAFPSLEKGPLGEMRPEIANIPMDFAQVTSLHHEMSAYCLQEYRVTCPLSSHRYTVVSHLHIE
ncbi:MAG: hypothetical protein HQL74_09665 [Magnetococcales bacterium]|nr:hypothetical protein [Magnetococcales bacterium]